MLFSQQVHQLSKAREWGHCLGWWIAFVSQKETRRVYWVGCSPSYHSNYKNKMMKHITFEHTTALSIINNDERTLMWCTLLEARWCSFWYVKYVNLGIFFLLVWLHNIDELVLILHFSPLFLSCSFFSSIITLSFSCPSSFQRSVGAPSRMSPLVVSCLQATQLHMSTTCTACGPLRLPLEARSGLNNTLSFLFLFFLCARLCVF